MPSPRARALLLLALSILLAPVVARAKLVQSSAPWPLKGHDGYVFDEALGWGHTVPGAVVTCMWWNDDWGGWVPWPAHLYEQQQNPQVTGASGYFAFFTPPGFYYLDVEGPEGFQRWRSPVVQVIDEIVHVNVPYTGAPAADHTVSLEVGPDGLRGSDDGGGGAVSVSAGSVVAWTSTPPMGADAEAAAALFERPVVRILSSLNPMADTRGFDSGMLAPNATYARAFETPGSYTYGTGTGHAGVVMVYAEGDPPPPVVDEDGDGAPDVLEMGPAGDDPGYDGDGDGVPDAAQAEALSFTNCTGAFVTARVDQGRLAGVSSVTNPAPDDLPPGRRLSDCFYRLRVEDAPAGGGVAVRFFTPGWSEAELFLTHGPSPDQPVPHWQALPVEASGGLWVEPAADGFVIHLADDAIGAPEAQADGALLAAVAPAEAGHRLAVRVQGDAAGAVTSDGPGIACPPDCDEWLPEGAVLTLSAHPDADAAFAGWSDPGCGLSPTCWLVMDQARTLIARFGIDAPEPDVVEAEDVTEEEDYMGCMESDEEVVEPVDVIEPSDVADEGEGLTGPDATSADHVTPDTAPDRAGGEERTEPPDVTADLTYDGPKDHHTSGCSGCALARRGDDGTAAAALLCLAALAMARLRARRRETT